jgi:Uma2 family endonuclease
MVTPTIPQSRPDIISLEDWIVNLPDRQEWVNGALVAKNDMTLQHGRLQAKLATYWRNYKDTTERGGEVYTEVPCRTQSQGCYPDVAYLTPELVEQYGNASVLPQSFPLIAEIVSPTDFAEAIVAKSTEYLTSGGEEVWLLLPENRWIIAITRSSRQIFASGDTVSTQSILPGFYLAVDELFA